jgi:hypothetical protein
MVDFPEAGAGSPEVNPVAAQPSPKPDAWSPWPGADRLSLPMGQRGIYEGLVCSRRDVQPISGPGFALCGHYSKLPNPACSNPFDSYHQKQHDLAETFECDQFSTGPGTRTPLR